MNWLKMMSFVAAQKKESRKTISNTFAEYFVKCSKYSTRQVVVWLGFFDRDGATDFKSRNKRHRSFFQSVDAVKNVANGKEFKKLLHIDLDVGLLE